jgi:hypothetical protein
MPTKLPTKQQIIEYAENKRQVLHERFSADIKDDLERMENLARQAAYADVVAYAKTGMKST